MDQARSTISKIFNGEPHSYTRFNLTQNMEGDNSQVEMKLSSDMDEEVGGNGVGDHLNHNPVRKPYVAQKLGRTPKNLCFMAAATLLIFIIGYLIGYLVHRKKDLVPSPAVSMLPIEQPVLHETGAAPLMDWDDVKELLAEKLTASKFEPVFSEFTSNSHQAGSLGDEDLANKVITRFKEYGMNTWTDEHFVKVQDPPASGSNRVVFKDGKEERPNGFLSYSANGTVTGAVVYAHYGQGSDFTFLQGRNINLNGRVVLVRAGRISFAEKVANAAKMNASAVLIYADPLDYSIGDTTQLFGHVHMGSGDPYTPGFPSFNHTQFPPVQSSGLPTILAQTITTAMATSIQRGLGGQSGPAEWALYHKLGDDTDVITVEVNNVLTEKKIHNVFGVIKGFVDADRYVVIGAQRDAWGPGFATSTVGTSVLVELARSISDMVKNDGFKPRRTIVFASWTAGEYGSVGATEWLEGYLSSLNMKAFSYINLDGVVTGRSGFKVAASPLMHGLIENTLKELNFGKDQSLFTQFGKGNWESDVLEPLKLDNAAYPFLAFSGIPSVSFRFTSGNSDYQYFGTMLDTREKLNSATANQVPQLAVTSARFAGHIALRLVHDHLLQMDLGKYEKIIRTHVAQINTKVKNVQRMKPQLLPKALTVQWLISAYGSYSRASRNLATEIQNSDLEDIEMCRIINDRIMAVERNFLSPYVSPKDSPFRHILLGSGPHTVTALSNHLDALRNDDPESDADLFRNQFALATWTIQGCANSLAGDIWSLDNEI
ncbi:transferrin receptor protein 1-like [Seriola dumerili]|uniref:Transferrin receptor protein 1 n=2 Tax=Seriola dumerili TaxID=41447 RepID=A0A3B4TR73_SERDU|nr:transferrin receptor protein 1-like [Seriola dumerili]